MENTSFGNSFSKMLQHLDNVSSVLVKKELNRWETSMQPGFVSLFISNGDTGTQEPGRQTVKSWSKMSLTDQDNHKIC